MEEDIKILKKFINIVKGKDYNAENGWHGYYDNELIALGKSLENFLTSYKQLEEENKILREYDYRNIKIDKEHKIKSPSFTKEQLDLINFGIALHLSIDELFNDEEVEDNF